MGVELNSAGVSHARTLIAGGSVDRNSGWSLSNDERKKLAPNCFLGHDPAKKGTEQEWKYPIVKGGRVYRSGVIAAKQRAGAEGATVIESAAATLLNLIDGKSVSGMHTKGLTLYKWKDAEGVPRKLGEGVEATPEMMSKINRFSHAALTPDDVYVAPFMVAHNAVDRDGERFHESVLSDFARTLPGKGYFNNSGGHPGSYGGQKGPAQGTWFHAETAMMSPDEFEAMTGERPQLPPGMGMMTVLKGHMYAIKMPSNEDMRKNIDGGIHRFVSLSFSGSGPVTVKDPSNPSNTLYDEWQSPGEAYETSSVWLGAQPGAVTVDKAACAGCSHNHINPEDEGENMEYKELYEAEKARREETETKHKDLVVLNEATETKLKDMKAVLGIKDGVTVADIKVLAAAGKAYRDGLIDNYIKNARLLGKCGDRPEDIENYKSFIGGWSIADLRREGKVQAEEAMKRFPDQAELPGEEMKDKKRTTGGPGEGTKSLETAAGNDWLE